MLLFMQVTLAAISARAGSKGAYEEQVRDYLKRSIAVAQCATEAFRNEKTFRDWIARQRRRTEPLVRLLDGRGPSMTSEALAAWLGGRRDEGVQHIVFAVGPADGWSEEMRTEASRRAGLLSLGPMTLAHQLARLVMAEQLYRACTILTGHPYHRGSAP
jgi:23S rRNA (pseudouridine1915-N3)-methyltransferase